MNAFIDRSGCIGCGLCPTLCPAVFAMGEDGLAEVIVPEVPGAAESAALEAQQNCPVMVISVDWTTAPLERPAPGALIFGGMEDYPFPSPRKKPRQKGPQSPGPA